VQLAQALCLDPRRLVLLGDEQQAMYRTAFDWRLSERAVVPRGGGSAVAPPDVKRLSLRTSHRCPSEIAAALRADARAFPGSGASVEPPTDRKRAGRSRPVVFVLDGWKDSPTVLSQELHRLHHDRPLPGHRCAVRAPRNQDGIAAEAAIHLWRRAAAVAMGWAAHRLFVLCPAGGNSAVLTGFDADLWAMRRMPYVGDARPAPDDCALPF